MLLVEEPELFLHPQAQRRLSRNLREFSANDHHQVFLCTHSPQFVDTNDLESLALLSKSTPQDGTAVKQCSMDFVRGNKRKQEKQHFTVMRYLQSSLAEMFFARRVVFVEGPTESVCIPYLAEKLHCVDDEVTVIEAGGKTNLPLLRVAGARLA